MTNKEYAESLRLIADWYQTHPEIPCPTDNVFSNYAMDSAEEAAVLIRALGTCGKEYNEYSLVVSKKFGDLALRFVFSRGSICTRKVVGKKLVPAKTVTYPEREEEIVEWDCGSILELKNA